MNMGLPMRKKTTSTLLIQLGKQHVIMKFVNEASLFLPIDFLDKRITMSIEFLSYISMICDHHSLAKVIRGKVGKIFC